MSALNLPFLELALQGLDDSVSVLELLLVLSLALFNPVNLGAELLVQSAVFNEERVAAGEQPSPLVLEIPVLDLQGLEALGRVDAQDLEGSDLRLKQLPVLVVGNAHHAQAILPILVVCAAPLTALSRGCPESSCVGAAGGGPDLDSVVLLRWRGRSLGVFSGFAGGFDHESL